MKLEIWDPRNGQDYALNSPISKKKFSSLQKNVFVIEAIGADWQEAAARSCLFQLAENPLAQFFTCQYAPWAQRKNIEKAFFSVQAIKVRQGDYIVASQYDEILFSRLLDARDELGGNDSGEWIFTGSQHDLLSSNEDLFQSISSLLDHIENFEWILYMAEMQQTFLFFKEFIKIDSLIKNLNALT